MKKLFSLGLCLAACSLASSAWAADTANLKAKFVVKGNVPAPKQVNNNASDPFCATFKVMSEDLVVDKDTGAIQNLALYADSKTIKAGDIPADQKKAPAAKLLIDNKECRFEPHVLVLRPGQTIEVKNSDKTGHNANFGFLENDAVNFQVPAGGTKDQLIKKEEPAPIPVSCGSHPWMKAFVIIQDHPFVGVTDAKGDLAIQGLPAGKVTLRVWQESGSLKNLTINGKAVPVKRGRIELELKPGENDLGTIEIDAKDLQ
jgi:plastocyanin